MTTFVINLARRTDRLAHMRRQLNDFERVDAIDGAKAKPSEVSGFRFWCTKGYRIRPGEVGCHLSHQKVWRTVLKRGLEVACVLEDDVTLAPDFASRVEALAAHLLTAEPTVLAFAETGAGYLINRAGAELMLRLATPIRVPVDDWPRWQRGGLVWRQIDGLLTVSPYGDPAAKGIARSDIIGDGSHFLVNMSVGRKFVYRIGRVIGKAVDALWP